MIELTGENLKLKYRQHTMGRYRSHERTSATGKRGKSKAMNKAEVKMRAEERQHQREINSHIRVEMHLLPSMKRRFVRTHVA
jgi:hypothetical protein